MTIEVKVSGAESLTQGSCHVIAEAGANHNNSVDRAIEMARRAAEAGAWAVKYQLYRAGTLAVSNSPKYWKDEIGTATQREAFELSDKLPYSAYAEIASACRDFGIVFFATPFDLDAVQALEDVGAPLYKIASGDITCSPLLKAVAETGKPVILSTGASTAAEVSQALEWLDLGPERLVLLACTLTYPTPDTDANLSRIETLRSDFSPYLVGYSDHTLGTDSGWVAAGLGAVAIEKHYTLDPALPDVPDHKMSVTPDELSELVRVASKAAVLRGQPTLNYADSELAARRGARRSIVTVRDVSVGAPITMADLGLKRPGTGIPPSDIDRVLGRVAQVEIPSDTLISDEMLS